MGPGLNRVVVHTREKRENQGETGASTRAEVVAHETAGATREQTTANDVMAKFDKGQGALSGRSKRLSGVCVGPSTRAGCGPFCSVPRHAASTGLFWFWFCWLLLLLLGENRYGSRSLLRRTAELSFSCL
ncbi:unnamed protein product [Ectocarpus fasciculatus]